MDDHRSLGSKQQIAADAPQTSNVAQRSAATFGLVSAENLDPAVLMQLHEAVLDADPECAKQAVRDLIANGIRAVDLADFYIPAVSRELGNQWCIDELNFASVTIGASRLQSMLRALGPNWSGEGTGKKAVASALLVVPQEVYHTLGALVLGGQLRRKGLSVKLVLDGKPRDIADRVANTVYDCVFISSSRGETLESLRRIVEAVKTSGRTPPPVVIGGTILEVETVETITALTGADFATQIPDEALRFCGLPFTSQDDARTENWR